MKSDMVPISDPQEWADLTAGAESEVYSYQSFILFSRDTELLVNSKPFASKVFSRLNRREGWDKRFLRWVIPLVTHRKPEEGEPHHGENGHYEADLSSCGRWNCFVPKGYEEALDDKEVL
jgi:hypothetical protein